jgi:acyl phosphate:glycerol-3-phosphate acyltransferase
MYILSIIIFISYILGSLNASLVLSKIKDLDIRKKGSGNAGATNAIRIFGLQHGLLVFFFDACKAFLAAFLTIAILEGTSSEIIFEYEIYLYFSAISCILGHCYPIWFGFKGGKGAATGLGSMIYIEPLIVIPSLIIFLIVLLISRYVSLSTIIAFFTLSITSIFFNRDVIDYTFLLFVFILFLIILYTHKVNISAILEKTEHQVTLKNE